MPQEEGLDTVQAQTVSEEPEWLVLIYLAGDNNLSPHSIAILQELIAADPPRDKVRVLACFDPNTPRPRGARYVEINRRRKESEVSPEPECWHLHNDLVPFNDLPGHPVTSPDFCNTDPPASQQVSEPVAKEGLSRFLNFALKNHKAKHYMLILFGHGSAVAGNTFLVDDNPPSFLRLKDFADVLARHFDGDPKTKKPKLDILACDNCMMNGVEIAYQLRGRVDYLLGSQGLMLTVGWPFRKLIKAIIRMVNRGDATPRDVARRMLRVCARNLVDFSLMDRSSEQAVCDLTTLRKDRNLVVLIRRLAIALHEGLEFDERVRLRHPAIMEAVRLARLEAQSYWAETFVDLYDFCEQLLLQCNEAMRRSVAVVGRFLKHEKIEWPKPQPRSQTEPSPHEIKEALLRSDPDLRLFKQIAERCWDVLEEIGLPEDRRGTRRNNFVVNSYYIGPELQYSHGVSVYFPWTLPQGPIIFEPMDGTAGGGSGGSYGLSWVSFDRVRRQPTDYVLKTAFDEYKTYDFAQGGAGDWAAFLERFFRATLRNIRRFDVRYEENEKKDDPAFFKDVPVNEKFIPPVGVDLQKSSSSTGDDEDCACPTIKNYPRRFYISPADCMRRCDLPRTGEDDQDEVRDEASDRGETGRNTCASYLGWNARGLVASVIGLEARRKNVRQPDEDDSQFRDDDDCEKRDPCREDEPRPRKYSRESETLSEGDL